LEYLLKPLNQSTTGGHFVTLVVLLLTACIEPIEPEIEVHDYLLVVEGHVSNLDEVNTVRLSRTRPLGTEYGGVETGALVYLEDTDESKYYFDESSAGVYQSDPACFVGQVGHSYTLHIETLYGSEYQSKPALLNDSPPIDSLYFKQERRLQTDGTSSDGIKILLDSHDPDQQDQYFRYEWEETYEIKVPYPSDLSVWVCYNTLTSTDILIANTSQLNEARVSELEVKYVSTEGYRLRSLYRLLVRQYALSLEGIKYWTELKKISESQGTLFDPLPYELPSNVFNPNNPNEQVIGFFDVGAVNEKEIYISRYDLLDLDFASDGCSNQIVAVSGGSSPPYGYCLAYQGTYGSGINYFAPSYCCDCQLYGTLEVPDFWPK
jgi:hypothetical protein